jgi:hypothetical protein
MMPHQRIALIFIILATAVKASTNMVHLPHPPTPRDDRTIFFHSDDVLLPLKLQKMLSGGENSPKMQPSSRRQNCHDTWCHVVRTQRHQPALPSAETIRTES